MREEQAAGVLAVLERIKQILEHGDNDYTYSGLDEAELIRVVNRWIREFTENDYSSSDQIKLFFAPTADFQEIAIGSGWHDEYMELATIIDRNIRRRK